MTENFHRDTIGDISRRSAARYPERTAIIFRDTILTFYELDKMACRFANLMLEYGVKKGDNVAILAYNSHFYAISLLGLAKIGAAQVPVNYMLNTEEISYVVSHCGARIFLVEDSLVHLVDERKKLFASVKKWGMIALHKEKIPAGYFDLEKEISRMPDDEPEIEVDTEDIAQIPYTSGTESKPKGAMLSHRALMSQYFSCIIEGQYEKEDVSMHALPLFHCAQLHCFLMPFIYVGAKSIILHKADPSEILKNIQTYQATHMFAPPTVWIGLLHHPEFKNHNLTSLKKGAYGASIMPIEVIGQLNNAFEGICLWNYYGQTEMSPVATILKPEDQLAKAGSAGKPVINVETRLMDDEGSFVGVGEVGEIVHRSGQVMSGYLNDPEKTAEAFKYGWFHSGDLGVMDGDGYLYVVDRKKDMIKTGGENVASREVEEVIYTHPAVAEAAVIGLPDPKWIEVVSAVVVPKNGARVEDKDIIDFCKERLAGFKCPKKVFIADELMKNPSGKILKRELRQKYAA